MPARNKRKSDASTPRSTRSKRGVKRAKSRKPRHLIRTHPRSPPNVYPFKRAYSFPVSIGVADTNNGVHLNTDTTVQFLSLHTKFKNLPDFAHFKDLFSEYKITSIKHRLVPFYKDNVTSAFPSTTTHANAIPNYEIYAIPVAHSVRSQDWEAMDQAAFNKMVNEMQRKSQRLMPSGVKNYWTTRPAIVGYKGPIDKDGGQASAVMERATWLNTDPAAIMTGGIDQTDVTHYGIMLAVRRVDGLVLDDQEHDSSELQHMGFRMEVDVYFQCRKVQ